MKDYYKILGVAEEASEEEIRACWIELTKRYHPDLKKTEEGDEKIREINEAYEILKDESARFQYDFERDLKRSFIKKAHLRQERRMNIRKTIVVPSSAILVLCLIAGFFLLRRGEVAIPPGTRVETDGLPKRDRVSALQVTSQTPPARADSRAKGETGGPEEINEGVTPPERKKEIASPGGQEMASLPPRRSPAVAERPFPPPARKESEAREKLARQGVTKPEIRAAKVVSGQVPVETPQRVVEALPKETPKQVARDVASEVSGEVPKQVPVALPKEASKEISKEVPKEASGEVPKEVAGEIPREMLKENPKEAPQQIARGVVREVPAEMPKALPREMPKEVSKEVPGERPREIPGKTASKASKGVPKEAPKEIPPAVARDVAKEVPKEAPKEVRQESARVIFYPGVKLTTWAKEEKTEKTVALRPSLLAKEDEVRQFFDNYVDRYHQKDARGFLSFFSTQAVQNQTEGFDAIRSIYTRWIDQSEELRYQIEGMKIEIYQHRVDVKARFRVEQKLKKDGAEKTWKGNIRWVLVKEGGRLKIRSLDYQNEESR